MPPNLKKPGGSGSHKTHPAGDAGATVGVMRAEPPGQEQHSCCHEDPGQQEQPREPPPMPPRKGILKDLEPQVVAQDHHQALDQRPSVVKPGVPESQGDAQKEQGAGSQGKGETAGEFCGGFPGPGPDEVGGIQITDRGWRDGAERGRNRLSDGQGFLAQMQHASRGPLEPDSGEALQVEGQGWPSGSIFGTGPGHALGHQMLDAFGGHLHQMDAPGRRHPEGMGRRSRRVIGWRAGPEETGLGLLQHLVLEPEQQSAGAGHQEMGVEGAQAEEQEREDRPRFEDHPGTAAQPLAGHQFGALRQVLGAHETTEHRGHGQHQSEDLWKRGNQKRDQPAEGSPLGEQIPGGLHHLAGQHHPSKEEEGTGQGNGPAAQKVALEDSKGHRQLSIMYIM